MKKFLLFATFCLTAFPCFALKLNYLGKVDFRHKTRFQKTAIGGLSALHYQADTQSLWALTDDRGGHSEPRIYKFKLSLIFSGEQLTKISLIPEEIVYVKQSDKPDLRKVVDLESMVQLPWGNFLIGSEGDNNRKPRQFPELIEVKPNGTFVRTYSLPEIFLPEASGQQSKGVRNNLGFEGMTQIPNKNEWIVGLEAPLLQDQREDKRSFVRWTQYLMPEAWVLKPAKQWLYQVDKVSQILSFQNGVSEILAIDDKQVLALERRFDVSNGMGFKVQLFLADLSAASDVAGIESLAKAEISDKPGALVPATKTLVFDFESLTKKIGKVENFEGMAWGPKLANGKSTLLLVSDDNFMRDLRTQVLVFSVDKE